MSYLKYSPFLEKFGVKVQKYQLMPVLHVLIKMVLKVGGCTYCNNNSFNPKYCKPKKVSQLKLMKNCFFFKKI